jgi:hypothetical protein
MTPIRCSSLNSAFHCPGATALMAAERPETDETRTGTIVHAWIARYLTASRPEANEWLIEQGRGELFDELQAFADWCEETLLPELPADRSLWAVEEFRAVDLGDGLTLTGHWDVIIRVVGRRIVIDWKHGLGQRWILPPIADDLQMTGYGTLADDPAIFEVQVYRVLVSDLEFSSLTMTRGALDSARSLVHAIARDVSKHGSRTPGPHCEHCLARQVCPERLAAIATVTDALVPYDGHEISLTSDQARRVALALGPIEEAVKALRAALKRQLAAGLVVEMGGKRLALVGSGERDKVVNGAAAIHMLEDRCGEDLANEAISTSKSAIEKACKAAEVSAKDAIEDMRGEGVIVSEPAERTMRWVKA